MSFVLLTIAVFSCKGIQTNNQLLENINKTMVYFNYTKNELCLLDIDTGAVLKSHKLDFDVQQYVIDKHGFRSEWYYSNNDKNIYLMRVYTDWNNFTNNNTRIYQINIETFESSEIFYSTEDFHNFCVFDGYIYLLSYVEPSSGQSNLEKNYIVKYNLLDETQEIINFNTLLPENEQIHAHDFYVTENTIILNGWYRRLELKNIYRYDLTTEMITILDENATRFSIIEDKIVYRKNDIELGYNSLGFETVKIIGSNLLLHDLTNGNTIVLPDVINSGILTYFLINKDIIVFSREHKTIMTLINKFRLFPNYDTILKDYYIADVHGNAQRKIFQNRDSISILGVMDNM